MTFPQTFPSDQVIKGGELWRLFTELESSGDIFESDQSGSAFTIGPQSDIACASITHFDPVRPNRSNIVEISTEKPFIGRLDAFASEEYGTGQKAKLLITPDDLIPSKTLPYQPNAFVTGDLLVNAPIKLDFIQYITAQVPTIIPKRTDRTHLYQAPNIPGGGNKTAWHILPFYGRRCASISFTANAGAIVFVIEVIGVIINNGSDLDGGSPPVNPEVVLVGPTNVSGGTTANFTINTNVNGMYDLLVVSIKTATSPAGPIDSLMLKIQTSDV